MDKLSLKDKAMIEAKTVQFGFNDDKGRPVAYKFVITAMLAVEDEKGWCCRAVTETGEWFQVWGTPVRGGKDYGPSFNFSYFRTLAEAEKHAAKLVKQSNKRMLNKFLPRVV